MKKKKHDKKCKNCSLFNPEQNLCGVTIIMRNGDKVNLPVYANDECFFEQEFIAKTPSGPEKFKPQVEQVKLWVEDPQTGEKTDHGKVKIEYPVGFFGEEV